MANILPEVQPIVTSMPAKGYELQTGGSARRSFIKNTDDTYFIHGVPGHTHNASAMISVTAEYSRKREVDNTINDSWCYTTFTLDADDYTDSIDLRDRDERFDRAIERGIGRIIMIPENTNHMIEEPVRSISEIRTIVSPKDQLKTLTYVSNVHGDGWVDPETGTASSAFNRDDPVLVNFYSYEGTPRIEYDTGLPPDGTMRQPVYIANTNVNTIRYAIAGAGSEDAAGNIPWDGNVPFYWDEAARRYISDPFTMFFPAYKLPSTVVGQAVQFTPTQGVVVPRQNFKVEFEGYETSKARDGYCVFSQHDALVVSSSTANNGQDLIAEIPVQVVHTGIEMFSLAYWYGPPAFRIPVGAPANCIDSRGRPYARAIPGPPRQQPNSFAGTYDDQDANTLVSCKPFFQILDGVTDYQYQARAYAHVFTSRINYMKSQVSLDQPAAPGVPVTNLVALKAAIWANLVRPFGYGEAMHTVAGLGTRTARHGFSSMLKYDNSPYLRQNGLYAPDKFDSKEYSDYTSDGVIPYPFIQPVFAHPGTTTTITLPAAARYVSTKIINQLFAMFPEEELHELRSAIDAQETWAQQNAAVRQAFFIMETTFVDGIVWQVTQPTDGAPALFKYPEGNPGNPWNYASTGGSVAHKNFVFTRLYRTFAQFKDDPSNVLDIGIKAGAQAEFAENQKNRLGAPAVSIRFKHTLVDPNGVNADVVSTMLTFPFRILCHQNQSTESGTAFSSEFKSGIATLRDSASAMRQGLVDTTTVGGGPAIAASAWKVDGIIEVSRRRQPRAHTRSLKPSILSTTSIFTTQSATYSRSLTGYLKTPTETAPTEMSFCEIYIGNPASSRTVAEYRTSCCSSTTTAPRTATRLWKNEGVTGVYDRAQTGALPQITATENDQNLATLNIGTGTGFNRVNMKIPLKNFVRLADDGSEDQLDAAKFGTYTAGEHLAGTPFLAIFVPGKSHSERFHDDNYELFQVASQERGKVFRNDVKISQHLCSPVLNPDMRLNCIAPLNHASRHLPPEMRTSSSCCGTWTFPSSRR